MHIKQLAIVSGTFPTMEHYPFNLDIFRKTREISFPSPISFFVGENGSGKSTLLKAIAQRCGLPIWRGVDRVPLHVNKYAERLYQHINVEWADGIVPGSYFDSEVFHNFAQILDEWAVTDPGILSYFGGESLISQSHGQCNMAYFRNRFRIKGLYLMDEPESALSPKRQLELLEILHEAAGNGRAQFIIATHSPILLAAPGAIIYSFDQSPVHPIRYEETDYYLIYRDFMNDPGGWLSQSR